MYGILVINRGMWGIKSWCKQNGKVMLFDSKEEAEKIAEKYNESQGPVNSFNEYFAKRYDKY